MKILITGHNGFIGKNLVNKLEAEHEITGYEYDSKLKIYNMPVVDGYDWVIHLGAISNTTERDVDKIMLQNYEFSKWLFKECNSKGINFQYASSASVYGSYKKFNEDDPKQPQSPYAWSKYLFDRWVWQQEHNVCVQGMRYFNVYGPDEEHKGSQASPITKFTKQAKEEGVITLFENSDKYERDFIFVGDVCLIHELMILNRQSGLFNIGAGSTTSFQKVAEIIAKKYNATIKYIPMPESLQGQYQEYTCADITKLKTVVNIRFKTVEEYIEGI
jgi:ADP-L-glycero-D-manno-heptose 6-epimerase